MSYTSGMSFIQTVGKRCFTYSILRLLKKRRQLTRVTPEEAFPLQ